MKHDLIIKKYTEQFRKVGNCDDAVFFPKGRQFYRFEHIFQPYYKVGMSLCDYGCGLGKFLQYTEKNNLELYYTGVDIVDKFIIENRKMFPHYSFLTIGESDRLEGQYDCILSSGTFNIISTNFDEHFEYVCNRLKQLYLNLNIEGVLVVDFMHDDVDFIQEGAFHVNKKQLRREFKDYNLELVEGYLPFEFALVLRKYDES